MQGYLSIANQMLETGRTQGSRALLSLMATLGEGYTAREKKSVAFHTRQWNLSQEQFGLVRRLIWYLCRPLIRRRFVTQVLSPFMVDGSCADKIVILRDADGNEEPVMIRLLIVSADMPQAQNHFRSPISPILDPISDP